MCHSTNKSKTLAPESTSQKGNSVSQLNRQPAPLSLGIGASRRALSRQSGHLTGIPHVSCDCLVGALSVRVLCFSSTWSSFLARFIVPIPAACTMQWIEQQHMAPKRRRGVCQSRSRRRGNGQRLNVHLTRVAGEVGILIHFLVGSPLCPWSLYRSAKQVCIASYTLLHPTCGPKYRS